jgi:hypothetical protein
MPIMQHLASYGSCCYVCVRWVRVRGKKAKKRPASERCWPIERDKAGYCGVSLLIGMGIKAISSTVTFGVNAPEYVTVTLTALMRVR